MSRFVYSTRPNVNDPATTISAAPGAWIINGATNDSRGGTPIYTSISDLNVFGISRQEDRVIILPGYNIQTFNGVNYGNFLNTYDNTNGSDIQVIPVNLINAASSVRLFYNNVEIIR